MLRSVVTGRWNVMSVPQMIACPSTAGAQTSLVASAAAALVLGVGDQEAAVVGGGHAERRVELGIGRRTAVAGEAARARARDGADRAVRRDGPNAVIQRVGDEQRAVGLGGDVLRPVE